MTVGSHRKDFSKVRFNFLGARIRRSMSRPAGENDAFRRLNPV
jgi:hypothetical protein